MKPSGEYKLANAACPICDSYNIASVEAIEQDGDIAWQAIECRECEATWVDQYKLIGYSNLKAGGRL